MQNNYRGITAGTRSIPTAVPIPTVLPWSLSPLPRNYRGYHGITAFPVAVHHSSAHGEDNNNSVYLSINHYRSIEPPV